MDDTLFEIRQETATDYPSVYNIHSKAFGRKDEARLADRLRLCDAFIPELSLVALYDRRLVGHIMFTEVDIVDGEKSVVSLSLAPMAVVPDMQNKGIGNKMVKQALFNARKLGYKSVIVLGPQGYYSRFGFVSTGRWRIKAPFNVPDTLFMGLELEENALSDVQGIVKYPAEFEQL